VCGVSEKKYITTAGGCLGLSLRDRVLHPPPNGRNSPTSFIPLCSPVHRASLLPAPGFTPGLLCSGTEFSISPLMGEIPQRPSSPSAARFTGLLLYPAPGFTPGLLCPSPSAAPLPLQPGTELLQQPYPTPKIREKYHNYPKITPRFASRITFLLTFLRRDRILSVKQITTGRRSAARFTGLLFYTSPGVHSGAVENRV
jgi:hypothetical protein